MQVNPSLWYLLPRSHCEYNYPHRMERNNKLKITLQIFHRGINNSN
nr:hypothetical protein Q903MT_gene4426 [Picea sitchensis]